MRSEFVSQYGRPGSYIYGKHPVKELLLTMPDAAELLLYCDSQHLGELGEALPKKLATSCCTSAELKRLCHLTRDGTNPQGIALKLKASLSALLCMQAEAMLEATLNSNKSLVWLPSTQDPHNLGAVIRTAAVLGGIYGLILPEEGRSANLNSTVAKVSAGNIFHLRYAQIKTTRKSVELINKLGFESIALENRPDNTPLERWVPDSGSSYVFILGGESSGIPKSIVKEASCRVRIPLNHEADSLNLSVAAGIVLHHWRSNLAIR